VADMPDATEIAAMVDRGDGAPLERVMRVLASNPLPASRVIQQLLSWPDGNVRFWALAAAELIYPRETYIQALKKATTDRDEAVRADAISRLTDLAPDYVRRLAKSLASRLKDDLPPGDKVFLLWTLAKTRAHEAMPKIADLRASEPGWTQLARVADVVLSYLELGEQPLLDRIRLHSDHERMEELCTLAWHVLSTHQAHEALEVGLADAPDEECRQKCREALRRFGSD
jgi:hypothetical protein